ncbi:MAG: hypothetical protein K0V04_40215, partial [Deltaproteobacteria bacterium]|nr:hypothetical protein [Deltaproteobacteria bacterium]
MSIHHSIFCIVLSICACVIERTDDDGSAPGNETGATPTSTSANGSSDGADSSGGDDGPAVYGPCPAGSDVQCA